ncbi:putative homeobox-leucine zipper protein ATHB-12-like [Capsicum annuum]|uniref:uncharacterized membrane protein At1g16860 n=1 Tax=Capsicum annuum TaxID=4072 RepID=UPI0007BEC8A1|nr:uncharacterized membrane protein At1g16860 [Capsicum annuum]KAF3663786.1 putative homeobox-leucine zipper protein ATHB-12-like [Capsicum annuum]
MNQNKLSLSHSNVAAQTFKFPLIPSLALYILFALFLFALSVSLFILVVVHNPLFFLFFLFLFSLIAAFLLWNSLSYRNNTTILHYLHSLPDSDLTVASHGHLVKITGHVSCGNASLESSYEKVGRCVYASTLLFECGELGLKPVDVKESCFGWRLVYSERLSTDFYITDNNSGIRAFVKAGPDSRVIPLIKESRLVTTAKNCKVLASHMRKWLRDRNLSSEARLLRLEEGYIKEGSLISVFGVLQRSNEVMVITPPQELISTGCLWKKLLLPVDVDGLILAIP